MTIEKCCHLASATYHEPGCVNRVKALVPTRSKIRWWHYVLVFYAVMLLVLPLEYFGSLLFFTIAPVLLFMWGGALVFGTMIIGEISIRIAAYLAKRTGVAK